jgi:hypothetical protein
MKWESWEEIVNQPMAGKPKDGVKQLRSKRVQRFWKSHFPIPYHELRRKLQAIAHGNLQKMGVPIFVGIPQLNAHLADLRQTLIVPVDDDDWLNPDLPNLLHYPTIGAGVKFNAAICSHNGIDTFPEEHNREHLTCNCAFTSEFLNSVKPILRNAWLAYHWKTPGLIFQPQEALGGVVVNHPGSISYLTNVVIPILGRSISNYLSTFTQKKPLKPNLVWCQDEYHQLTTFIGELL